MVKRDREVAAAELKTLMERADSGRRVLTMARGAASIGSHRPDLLRRAAREFRGVAETLEEEARG